MVMQGICIGQPMVYEAIRHIPKAPGRYIQLSGGYPRALYSTVRGISGITEKAMGYHFVARETPITGRIVLHNSVDITTCAWQ